MLGSLFPLLYGPCSWPAVAGLPRDEQGFRAASGPISNSPSNAPIDRTGRVTVHPELLDSEGRITEEALLTVRFGGDDEAPTANGPGTE